jgi:hypothetical protein
MNNEIVTSTLKRYKKLLQLINRLPQKESQEARKQLRAEMKRNSSVSESEAEILRRQMDDKMRYLKMITPKLPGDSDDLEEVSYYVVRNGNVVKGTAARETR